MAMVHCSAAADLAMHVVRPPPGLEDVCPDVMFASSAAAAGFDAGHFTQGDWANAVAAAMPNLDTHGLQAALKILDTAAENIKRMKALKTLGSTSSTSFAAELLMAEIRGQQQDLLQSLRSLRISLPSVAPRSKQAAKGAERAVVSGAPVDGGRQVPDKRIPQTLAGSLQSLSDEDPECLFVVRRISKLGFKAARTLKQHFRQYGDVCKVLMVQSFVRQSSDGADAGRQRPSSMGFVHMESAAAVRQVLAAGADQEVGGCMIRVQRFQRHEEASCEGDDMCEPDSPVKSPNFARQVSCLSAASTRTSASTSPFPEEPEAVRWENRVWSF